MTKKKKHRSLAGVAGKILIAAVLVSLLGVTASAAEYVENWFLSFFSDSQTGNLTSQQVQYIRENTHDIGASQTMKDYTLHVDSAITDGQKAYLMMTLTSDKGKILDADSYLLGWDGSILELRHEDEESSAWAGVCETLGDRDPHTVWLMASFSLDEKALGKLTDTNWFLVAENLYESRDGNIKRLSKGTWKIPVTFSAKTDVVQLVQEEQIIQLDINNSAMEGGTPSYTDYKLRSLTISAMSANLQYVYLGNPTAEELQNEPYTLVASIPHITAVMKNGSTAVMQLRSANLHSLNFSASTPVLLEEVDHVLLPDGTKLEMQDPHDDGYSFTLDSVLTDGQVAYITLDVTVPEEIPSPGEGWEMNSGVQMDSMWICPANQEKATIEQILSMGGISRRVDDGDGKDNTYKLVMGLYLDGTDTPFAPGTRWKLHIGRLISVWHNEANRQALIDSKYAGQTDYMIEGEDMENILKEVNLTEDIWEFILTFDEEVDDEVELVTAPIPMSGYRHATLDELMADPSCDQYGPYEIQLVSLKISPLSYSLMYTAEDPYIAQSVNVGEYTLVMKDGKNIPLLHYMGRQHFEEPILLENVDHVLLPNGSKLYLP